VTVPLFVAGASGMLAGELLRLVEQHPGLALAGAFSRTEARLADVHPHCPVDVVTQPGEALPGAVAAALTESERAALVLALPHGSSVETFVALRDALGADVERVCVVDLAADFRLRDPQRYRAAYGAPHAAPHELAGFVYGLVEHRREEIVGARRVAAPGCFATAMQLAVLPAARAGLLDAQRAWVLDGVTGSSGSGRDPKPATHHPHRHGNLWAYALDGHRHEAELAQALDGLGIAAPLHFVPHSGPFARGIHLTAHLPLARATDVDAVRAVYADAYADQPFVEVLREGVPDLRRVVGSNRASLAVHVRGELLTVLLTLDNMIKGGAGQGLQCLNLMLDMPETWGLARSGLGVA
jgi:N-acetyl-gamma-glutamyl-phosphate reductase